MKLFYRIPHALILVAFWAVIKNANVSTTLSSLLGVVILLFAFAVMVMEFVKSGDITLRAFAWDMVFAVITVIVATSAMTHVVLDPMASVSEVDATICAVAVLDAILSPFNSFRIAQRNFAVGGVGN
jgi:hypothetical protein